MTVPNTIPPELSVDLRSLAEFTAFVQQTPGFLNAGVVAERVQRMVQLGGVEPLTGAVIPPGQLHVEGTNYRESLLYANLVSRHRGVLGVMESFLPRFTRPLASLDVYAPESVTAFAQRMRAMAPGFIGSEYAASESARKQLRGIRIEDLTQLTFPSESFDVIVTNDVLEHVPSIDASLREMLRVLRPGGVMISTHPFVANSDKPVVRAELINGAVVHHMAPEYHGNPVDPQGSLVFEVPGWDIVKRCRNAGASDAFIRVYGSIRHGVIGAHECGIYVTVAVR